MPMKLRQLKLHSMFPRLGLRFGRGVSRLPARPGANYLRELAAILGQGWQKLALLALYGLGLFIGAKTAAGASSGWQSQLLELLRAQRMNRGSQSVWANAMGYFGVDFLFMLAAFLLGLCAVGLPLVLLLPVLRGLGMGVLSGWLYMTQGFTGIGYSVLILYPSAVISMLVMLSYCKESMAMAGDMLLLIGGKLEHAENTPRQYISRYLGLLAVSIFAAITDALCYAMFVGVFEI